jgi:hypothetical protein
MEKELVQATWGLVVATALLAIASIVPLIRDTLDRREERRRIGAGLVPDIMILRSRLVGGSNELAASRSWSEQEIKDRVQWNDEELDIIDSIIVQGSRPSLLFVNELYLVRHLLTQAKLRLERSLALTNKTDAEDIKQRDDKLASARIAYAAALASLDAAAQLLPRKARTINGEGFWDRFAHVSDERESEAEESYTDKGSIANLLAPLRCVED